MQLKHAFRIGALPLALLLLNSCGHRPVREAPTIRDQAPEVASSNQAREELHYTAKGIASWYGKRFQGRRTASGERFDRHALTAAHPSLPFGTRLKVTCLATGRSVVVRVNDRGPRSRKRIIDLSYQAAKEIGLARLGTSAVELEAI